MAQRHSTRRHMQYITQLISKTSKVILFLAFVSCVTSCSSATVDPERINIKDPGPKSRTFASPFQDVWKASLLVLGKYSIKSYDEDSGIIETDFIRGEDAWISPHRKKYVPGGFRYKLNLRVIKGRTGAQKATKVILLKTPELQKDFFSDSEAVQTDGLEELSILYRIERELALDQALSKVKRN